MDTTEDPDMFKQKDRHQDLIDLVGRYGPWQRNIFIIFFFASFPTSWHNLGISFFAAEMDHWCARPPLYQNMSVEMWKNLSIPQETINGVLRYSQCNMYTDEHRNDTKVCTKWEYNTSEFYSTIINEWDLVCDKNWFVSLSQSIYMAGFLVAVLLFGQLSDRFGRRPVMLSCIAITFIFGLIGAFSVSFPMYAVCRFMIALGASGLFTTAFVMLVEIVGPEHRSVFGIAIEFGWAAGYVLLPCFAWLTKDWFYLQLTVTIPVAGLVIFWWCVPESPRWLLSQGRLEECEAVLKNAAEKNGKQITEEFSTLIRTFHKEQEASQAKHYTIVDLLKYPNMRRKTLNIYLNWCVNAFIYYGLSLNTSDLGGNIFINFFISGAVEFPAYAISILVIVYFGRKLPLMTTMIVGGLACVLTIPVPANLLWLRITLAMIGKFCITASFGIVYVFSAEIFPTVVRNVGVGSSSTFARIGSAVAPFVKELGQATHRSVPLSVYGVLSVISGALVILLPETNNRPVPDTIEQAEKIKRKSGPTENGII